MLSTSYRVWLQIVFGDPEKSEQNRVRKQADLRQGDRVVDTVQIIGRVVGQVVDGLHGGVQSRLRESRGR